MSEAGGAATRDLLWMMPSRQAPSELWMTRMLGHVEGRLAAIACYDAPAKGQMFGVPLINLGSRARPASIAQGEGEVEALLASGGATKVVAHYLPFALRYESLFSRVSAPLWVHAHGYDLTWDLARADGKGRLQPFHPPTYRQDVVRLSGRARILSNSKHSTALLASIGVAEDRIDLKYLGVPVGDYVPPVAGRPDCLYLGRLVDFKGPLETIAAFSLAADAGFTGHLTVAGDGDLRTEVHQARSRSKHKDRIRILGPVDAATGERLRSTHRIFTAHSQRGPTSHQEEALGVAYLEGMAGGLPIVSANGGSLPEIVRENETGLLFQPGDLQAHADGLLRLGRDDELYGRLSRAAHADARARFSETQERDTLNGLLDMPRVEPTPPFA